MSFLIFVILKAGYYWLDNPDDLQMHGTFTINENTLFRIAELKKS